MFLPIYLTGKSNSGGISPCARNDMPEITSFLSIIQVVTVKLKFGNNPLQLNNL